MGYCRNGRGVTFIHLIPKPEYPDYRVSINAFLWLAGGRWKGGSKICFKGLPIAVKNVLPIPELFHLITKLLHD